MTKIVIRNNKYNKKKILPCSVGYYPKSWVWHDDKYCLAKLNDNEKTNENFGELLYSIIAENIGMNCVEAHLCTLENTHKRGENNDLETNQAVLIENFLQENQKLLHFAVMKDYFLENAVFPTVEYSDMLFNNREGFLSYHIDLGNFSAWCKTINYYVVKNGYNLSDYQTELAKYLILDWFFMQEDRSSENLAFIIEGNNLKLAPCYDNGRCMVFYEHCNENLCLDNIINSRLKFPQIADFNNSNQKVRFNPERYDIATDTQSMDIIISLSENNKEIKKFVEKILKINMKDVLKQMDTLAKEAGCDVLEDKAKMLAEYFFDYKINNFKKYAKKYAKKLEK